MKGGIDGFRREGDVRSFPSSYGILQGGVNNNMWRRVKKYVGYALLFGIALLAVVVPARGGETMSFSGMVFVLDWDEENRVTAVSVVTEEGREYRVLPDEAGRELFRREGDTVDIEGVAGTDAAGRKTLTVIRYRVHP